jgi:hypothetical protein
VWIAFVFVLLGAVLGGVKAERNWLPAGAAAVGLTLLLALNFANPEAFVVRRNVARDKVDMAYLRHLSDDAVPSLVRAGIAPDPCPPAHGQNWAAANWSRHQADEARKGFAECPQTGQP